MGAKAINVEIYEKETPPDSRRKEKWLGWLKRQSRSCHVLRIFKPRLRIPNLCRHRTVRAPLKTVEGKKGGAAENVCYMKHPFSGNTEKKVCYLPGVVKISYLYY